MSTIDLTNNGVNETGSVSEGLSPGRSPMEDQRGLGPHPATAPWTKEENGLKKTTEWLWNVTTRVSRG